MLAKVRSGSNWAADLRRSSARTHAAPLAFAAPVLEVFDVRSVFCAVKMCGWAALFTGGGCGAAGRLGIFAPEQGYYLLEAAIVIGCAAPAILALGGLILLFGYVLQAMSLKFAQLRASYQCSAASQEETSSLPPRMRRPFSSLRSRQESETHDVLPEPSAAVVPSGVRLLARFGSSGFSFCALVCFGFLPQYQMGESYNGVQCVRAILTATQGFRGRARVSFRLPAGPAACHRLYAGRGIAADCLHP
jgi:hypothetical protein